MESRYYGVIGNRDYIKRNGEKRPYWEYLNEQPYGYLSSIVYARKDCPDLPMIWDCGAWSYRKEDVPKIGKYILTPGYALFECYENLANPGDIVIAPDHMLIDGVDLNKRRKINNEFARDFIKLCPKKFVPMATSHGMDIEERIKTTQDLTNMGYKHIAIGGVAARASQKQLVKDTVTVIRKEFPDIWLHVLGLSSPDYAKTWNEYGVNSFDGSSHFKQAFTGGAFFMIENGKLKKYQAVQLGEPVIAPICDCIACEILREEGIDTRTYSSNENNMGRAAHNQNMLMQAQKIAIHGTTVLVSCVVKKSNETLPAKDIYKSDWFLKAKRYAKEYGDRWYILSAKHGLLNPNTVIDNYEKTLNKMSFTERGQWSHSVVEEIKKHIPKGRIVFLAGEKYRRTIEPILKAIGYFVETPMQGMGIGKQLQWLKSKEKEKQLCLL